MSTSRILLAVGLVLAATSTLLPQSSTDENMGATLAFDNTTTPETWSFSWWGKAGKQYFVLRSTDLQTWTAMPGINPNGADAVLSYGEIVEANIPTIFFRAVEIDPSSPPVTGNVLPDVWERFYFGMPEIDPNADPDADGLTTLQEFMLGTNPTVSDTDGDGYLDGVDRFPLDPTKQTYAGTLTMTLVAPTGATKLSSY